jgi:hypothetical protein
MTKTYINVTDYSKYYGSIADKKPLFNYVQECLVKKGIIYYDNYFKWTYEKTESFCKQYYDILKDIVMVIDSEEYTLELQDRTMLLVFSDMVCQCYEGIKTNMDFLESLLYLKDYLEDAEQQADACLLVESSGYDYREIHKNWDEWDEEDLKKTLKKIRIASYQDEGERKILLEQKAREVKKKNNAADKKCVRIAIKRMKELETLPKEQKDKNLMSLDQLKLKLQKLWFKKELIKLIKCYESTRETNYILNIKELVDSILTDKDIRL